MTLSPRISELLRSASDDRLEDVHVSMPARVTSYDKATRTCSAQPLLRRRFVNEDDEDELEAQPIVNDVPVMFPGAGGYVAPHPLEPGDTVYLVFSDGPLDTWKHRGGMADPIDGRSHHLSDAVAFPGLRSRSDVTGTMPDSAWPFIVPPGARILLGSELASESALRGDAFRTALNALLDALAAAITTANGAAGTAATTAINAFKTTWAATLSPTVKVL